MTEDEARAWIETHGRGSVRGMAKAWGWTPSRVQRLLAKIAADTPSDTPALFHETPDTPPARKEDPGSFDWCDVDKVTLAGSPMLAVYEGAQGHIVIRAAGNFVEDDAVILINPHDLPQVIHKLTRLYRAWRGNQNEEGEP